MPTGIYQRKPRSPEYRQHIREALLDKKHSPERIEANRQGQIKRFLNPIEREKARRARTRPNKHPLNPTSCKLRSELAKARWANPIWRKRTCLSIKQAANRPEIKARNLRHLRDGLNKHTKPNKPETRLLDLLNIHFPNQWKYVGNWEFVIGHRNPDFININGKKQIIELFGSYWHSLFDIAKVTNFYRQYGFDTLIIWEDELKNEKRLTIRICKFTRTYSKKKPTTRIRYKPEGGAEVERE